MKATKYISLAALALMGTLASCQSDDEAADLNARPADAVSVNFSVGSLQGTTRSNALATDEAQYQFNTADQVCVNTAGQDPVTYQYDGQKWNEATADKFLVWTADQQNFQAYYPANVAGTSMTTFTVPTDQSTVEKINAADYMTGQRNVSKGNEVQMTLNRQMARVIIRISGFGNQYFDDQKTVKNVRIYSEASGIADGNPTGSSTEIQPYAQGSYDDWSEGWRQNSTFTALVVPGYGDSGARFIQLSDGEGSTLLVKGIPELEAGNSYTFNLMVGKNRIEVASVTVTDWTTGETLSGGQAEEKLTPALSITSPSVGQVIGSDGKNYAYGIVPSGVTAVAKICYVSGSHGLALALADEQGTMNWSTAQTTCAAHTPAITGGTWKLASRAEWDNMINAAGSYTALRDGFNSVGGTNMQKEYYWSSTAPGSDYARGHDFWDGSWDNVNKEAVVYARACLAF